MVETRDFKTFKIIEDITVGDIKTAQEALELKAEISESIIWIKDQISHASSKARATGEYANPEWYNRAKTALRFRRFSLQRLQEIYGQLAKKERMVVAENKNNWLIQELRLAVGEEVFFKCVKNVDERARS
jgi:hypothetical protein